MIQIPTDLSRLNPIQTYPIYVIKTPSRGFQKRLTSCSNMLVNIVFKNVEGYFVFLNQSGKPPKKGTNYAEASY